MALYICSRSLCNVTDRRLRTKRGAGWMDDDKTLTIKYQSDCVTKGREQLARDGKPATHGQMVAELNFGFWGSLFGRRSHHLWQDLRPIFQIGGIQRNSIALQLD